ncbi:MAG: Fic family protein [Desulfobacterales bacterium]|nr:Fic family protein [Desulfobacterales bacterium]
MSEEEIKKIQEGWKLPPSREYQEIEVKNIINAFNTLLREVIIDNNVKFITPEIIKQFHKMISENLGEHISAIPGKFRKSNCIVGTYRPPEYKYVNDLVKKLCDWLKREFNYGVEQSFSISVIQAIVTHVYIEWIHPFGDGNGRTGRLLEFYILLRAGLPIIVSHILSNFYNQTRSEYYRQLEKATKKKDITWFIEYAVQGFRDGLYENLKIIQSGQFDIFWQNYIYESFSDVQYTKIAVFKRKRQLMLNIPKEGEFTSEELTLITPQVARLYSNLKKASVLRDLKELQELGLLEKVGRKYKANIGALSSMIPQRKNSEP